MCTLKARIKLSIFGNIFLKIEKVINTFSILKKKFSKNENYCVPLGHTLAKSMKKLGCIYYQYYYLMEYYYLIKLGWIIWFS